MAYLPPPVKSLTGGGVQSPVQGPPCPFELGCGAVPILGAQCHVIFDVLVLCDLYKPVRGTLVPLMTRTSKTLKVKAKLMEGLGRSPSVFDLVDTWAIITVSTPKRTWKGWITWWACPTYGRLDHIQMQQEAVLTCRRTSAGLLARNTRLGLLASP